MKIIALVENNSNGNLKAKHGLSLYIKTKSHNILFDLGPDNTLIKNASKKGIDLNNIDTVIISHGHKDHGGGLKEFLKVNNHAKIYVQRTAFEKHFTSGFGLKFRCDLDSSFMFHEQVVLVDGDYKIDDELELFTVKDNSQCYSPMNDALFDYKGNKDTFNHEHNLIIHENKNVLIMGCGHNGVVNIMNTCRNANIDYCIGGFHLFNPVNKKTVSNELLDEIAYKLEDYSNTSFYTCHCTGMKAYNYLKKKMKLKYLSCGDEITIE